MKKILLIGKPWRGGLAKYIYWTLEEMFPGRVEWISTRPLDSSGWAQYRLNKKLWKHRLLEHIESSGRQIALFINHLPEFSALEYHPGNILWLTDGPSPAVGDFAPYARIYLSDPGYLDDVASVVAPERLFGELGFACCPRIHSWGLPREEDRQICFVANMDPKRNALLWQILEAGLPLTVYGNHSFRHPLFWRYPRHFSLPVANEEMGKIYSRYRLSLNVHAQVVREGTNMRTFECAAYGIPQLVEYRPGIEKYFEPGREIMTFTTLDELYDSAQQLLKDARLRNEMAMAAKQRVLAEHTYRQRLSRLFKSL